MIDSVTNGTKPHIPKPSFNTLPYFSGSFVQMINGSGCGVVYLTPAVVLLPTPAGASGGMMLI
jgi:hypothetical protein